MVWIEEKTKKKNCQNIPRLYLRNFSAALVVRVSIGTTDDFTINEKQCESSCGFFIILHLLS